MRLGLDIGTSSIGWWLYDVKDGEIAASIDGGVRVFSDGRDPQTGISKAVDRRVARAARRRRDRYLRRRSALMKHLSSAGLMPSDPVMAKELEALDPYYLRAKALDQQLPLPHLGRTLFHLNQRRGFKSNRKTERGDNESGKIKDATARLDQAMMAEHARTYGEFLYQRRAAATDPRQIPAVRTRLTLRPSDSGKTDAGYDFYPDRRHLEHEFNLIWTSQAQYYPDILTAELHDRLFEIIFFQRPLKEQEVGLCLFAGFEGVPKDERRLAKAHPVTQRRVLYETVNSLRITADGHHKRALSQEQRDIVVHALDNRKHTKSPEKMACSFAKLEKLLNLKPGEHFTLQTQLRDRIACDPVKATFSHPDRFGGTWATLDLDRQWEVVKRVQAAESDEDVAALTAWLMADFALSREQADATIIARLPEGYARLGETASKRLLKALRTDVVTYDKAVLSCSWHHSDHRTGEVLDHLPYYGKVLERHVIPGSFDRNRHDPERQAAEFYGRLTNPTVHIGLNQLRRVVNQIIATYGKPDEIVVELARDLKRSETQKLQIKRKQRDHRILAEQNSATLKELGLPDTGANRMLLRLYKDLGPAIGPRQCPYTGQPISVSMVFDGSCDVDHILPYSRTLDDSIANKTLCLREANRHKRNKTPWEAWGGTAQWDAIAANLKNLPQNKTWRFAPDSMEVFEEQRSFLDRALVDTQYLGRLARSYLDKLYDGSDGKRHVWVVPGRLTEKLRRHWGLNSLLPDHDRGAVKAKNRTDHRHHAIDAAVIGATDHGLLTRISRAAAQEEGEGLSAEDVARSTPEPWPDFRNDVASRLKRIVVSQRADHGRVGNQELQTGRDSTSGQLHDDTAQGIVDHQFVVKRIPLLSLKAGDIAITAKGRNIRDSALQKILQTVTTGRDGKEFEQALASFSQRPGPYQGIRRVRIIEALQESARVEITGADGKPWKAYKSNSNHCYDIWRLPDGKLVPQVVTTFQANTNMDPRPHPAAKRLLRVFKRDMVAIDRDGQRIICYVQSLHEKNGLLLAPHNEANADARNRDKTDPFRLFQMSVRSLAQAKIRRVSVSEMGQVRDPGPPPWSIA